jgi:signal transduction histidine kinase
MNNRPGSQESDYIKLGVQTLALTVAHDLNRSLIPLQMELDMALYFEEPVDQAALERMQELLTQIIQRIRAYQKIEELKTVEPAPGIRILDMP